MALTCSSSSVCLGCGLYQCILLSSIIPLYSLPSTFKENAAADERSPRTNDLLQILRTCIPLLCSYDWSISNLITDYAAIRSKD